jgi:hypothetical protein
MDRSLPDNPAFADLPVGGGSTGETGSYRSVWPQGNLERFEAADGDIGGLLDCDSGIRTKAALKGRGASKGLPGTADICTWLTLESSRPGGSYRYDCKLDSDACGDTNS